MTRDEILALDDEELNKRVADALGWRVIQREEGYFWIPPRDVAMNIYKPGVLQHYPELGKFVEFPNSMLVRWTRNHDAALHLFWHLQATYGAACVLTNAEWGEKMVLAVCQGVDSGPPAPLGIALCRLLLMLVERDKQEQSVIVEGNNGT